LDKVPTTAENVSTCLQNNWNDSIGVAKNDITWPVERKSIAPWLANLTKTYCVACYCTGERERLAAQDTWRIDDQITVDVLLKATDATFANMFSKRAAMKEEVKRIIHSQQAAITGVSLAWIMAGNSVEQPQLLRQILLVNCLYFHVKT
jgi:hypothetical protein